MLHFILAFFSLCPAPVAQDVTPAPIIWEGQTSPDYPDTTALGNPRGTAEHRAAQSTGDAPIGPDGYDPVYDTVCTFDRYFLVFVCPTSALAQNPDLADELTVTWHLNNTTSSLTVDNLLG